MSTGEEWRSQFLYSSPARGLWISIATKGRDLTPRDVELIQKFSALWMEVAKEDEAAAPVSPERKGEGT